jgi:hypothetical protein
LRGRNLEKLVLGAVTVFDEAKLGGLLLFNVDGFHPRLWVVIGGGRDYHPGGGDEPMGTEWPTQQSELSVGGISFHGLKMGFLCLGVAGKDAACTIGTRGVFFTGGGYGGGCRAGWRGGRGGEGRG